MSFDEIVVLVCGCASILITAILNIVNYVRTGKLPSRVSSAVTYAVQSEVRPDVQSVVRSDVQSVQSVVRPDVSDIATAFHDHGGDPSAVDWSRAVYVDHDYDEVIMSRSMYQYFLDCEKRVLGDKNGNVE